MAVTTQPALGAAIRPFTVETPEAQLDDLRARILATRWPEQETVCDDTQGVQLATMQEIARYWATDYDWRRCEAELDASRTSSPRSTGWTSTSSTCAPSMRTRCRSIVTHGWPGSVIEQLKIIEPLTDPTAHGGERVGRLPRRDPVDAGLRLLRQADRDRLGPGAHRAAPGSI